MNPTAPKVMLSAEGFTARADLLERAEAKATKLRRHEHPRVGHVRLHVRLETPRNDTKRFAVSATAETRGPDLVAHSTAVKPETAINAVFTKLERGIAAATGERKHGRQKLAAVTKFPPNTAG